MNTTANLKRFKCSFRGKHKGAIGIYCKFSGVEVWAESPEDCAIKIYDTHEHITGLCAEQVSPDDKFEATENPSY